MLIIDTSILLNLFTGNYPNWMLTDILMAKDTQHPVQQPTHEVHQCSSNDEQAPILPVSIIN